MAKLPSAINGVGQALNSTGGKLLGIGVIASASEELLRSAKTAISGGGMFGGPGGVPSNALENLMQTEMFAQTTSGVRNFFVGILEAFKVIRDLFTGDISFNDIMSGKISATEALSSAKTREDNPPNALESTYDTVASNVEKVMPDVLDQGNKELALAEAAAGGYGAYRIAKAYKNRGNNAAGSDNDKTPPGDKKGMPDKKLSEMSQADQDVITGKKKAGPEIKASVETPVAETHGGRGGSKFTKAFKLAGLAGAATLGTVAIANATTNDADADNTVGDTDLSNTSLADMTNSEINLKGDFKEASMTDELMHKGHVLAHGFQDGMAGLVGAPEDLYNMVDGWTDGWLPGDHNVNNSYNFATEAADNYLISKPELKSVWDERVHATGGVASWFVPVGGALKLAGAGARTVSAVHAFEAAENVVGSAQIGQMATSTAKQFIFQ